MSDASLTILAGNPNTGKTTLYNQLTGAQQRVGNWPGVSVEKKSGTHKQYDNVEVVDLPGIYSLDHSQTGVDEQIARQYLTQQCTNASLTPQTKQASPLLINVLDASNLKRNLMLTQQLMTLNCPMIVVVNMLDVAHQQGLTLNIEALSTRLNLPVFAVVASTGEGVAEVNDYILAHTTQRLTNTYAPTVLPKDPDHPQPFYQALQQLSHDVVSHSSKRATLTDKIDNIVLNPWLALPIFFAMMYLMFAIAINVGAVFIDFFDILMGAFFIDGLTQLLSWLNAPPWLIVLLAQGVGGGIQLVATFIPVIACLYLCLSFLEDSGYMSRAAFVVDRFMANIGLSGQAFMPLIIGFGCNVPSVMATRSLKQESERLRVILMAPFMSCGAKLTVYALFAAAFFPSHGQNIVFLLYFLGIFIAVLSAWLFKKTLFNDPHVTSFTEMPAYHRPVWRNIIRTTQARLSSFIKRAGKTIILVVVALSVLNSVAIGDDLDGQTGIHVSFGHENTDQSLLSVIGKTITPLFEPMGLHKDNWPAAVGIFTGMFAKEAVVGTLDALYQSEHAPPAPTEVDLMASIFEALLSIKDNALALSDTLTDPLGITLSDVHSLDQAATEQGVNASTLSLMQPLFKEEIGAFCYLVFILLYAPCIAVLGAIVRESGGRWACVVFTWTTSLAYVVATSLYQISLIKQQPWFTLIWLTGGILWLALLLKLFKHWGQTHKHPDDIIAVG